MPFRSSLCFLSVLCLCGGSFSTSKFTTEAQRSRGRTGSSLFSDKLLQPGCDRATPNPHNRFQRLRSQAVETAPGGLSSSHATWLQKPGVNENLKVKQYHPVKYRLSSVSAFICGPLTEELE